MLQAVYRGLSASSSCKLSEEEIKEKVLEEFLEHREEYMPYSAIPAEETLAYIQKWADAGLYATDSADLILFLLSRALDIRIVIVQESCEKVTTLELLPRNHDLQPETVTLIKRGQHFNYAVDIMKKEAGPCTYIWESSEVIVINSSSDSEGTDTGSLCKVADAVSPIR